MPHPLARAWGPAFLCFSTAELEFHAAPLRAKPREGLAGCTRPGCSWSNAASEVPAGKLLGHIQIHVVWDVVMGWTLCEETSLGSISPPCEFSPFPTFDQEVASDPLGEADDAVSVFQGRGGRAAYSLWILLSKAKPLKKTYPRFERCERETLQRECLEKIRATWAFLSLPPNWKWRSGQEEERRETQGLWCLS